MYVDVSVGKHVSLGMFNPQQKRRICMSVEVIKYKETTKAKILIYKQCIINKKKSYIVVDDIICM